MKKKFNKKISSLRTKQTIQTYLYDQKLLINEKRLGIIQKLANHKKPSSKALTAVRKTFSTASFENALKAERTKLSEQFINLETAYIVRKAIQRRVKTKKSFGNKTFLWA